MDLSNDNIIHIKEKDAEYLKFKRLLEYKDKLQHCFAIKPEDYKEDNGKNYKDLYETIGLDIDKLVRIKYQAHSSIVEKVENENQTFDNIDGLVTDKKGISLSIRVADCIPILLYDPTKSAIGNIHSGWKGTIQKIAVEGVKKLIQEYGSNPEDIIACLGPSIGKCHFEVDEDVKNIFVETFGYMNINERIITKGEVKEGKQKYFVDTIIINRKLLEDMGLKPENIIESNICTVCHSDKLHSYRVDKENSGRNTSIIGLI